MTRQPTRRIHRPGAAITALPLLCILLAIPAAQGAAPPALVGMPGAGQQVSGSRSTPPDFTVAFLGDQGVNREARAVLALIQQERPSLVLILGDLGYGGGRRTPRRWMEQLDEGLGPDIPVLAVIGNHDVRQWERYEGLLRERQARIRSLDCSGEYGVDASCWYQGLFVLLSGIGTSPNRPDFAPHTDSIARQLAGSDAIWKICGWHKTQRALQVGAKDDEVGWVAYEACRTAGALIVTAHEHSYSRTKTLVDIPDRRVSPDWPERDTLLVSPGSTFVAVAGLGGESIRNQERCRPVTYPYGCDGEWASIYTSDQDAKAGALFITFHVDGDPRKARGYFKNVEGETIDTFTVHAG